MASTTEKVLKFFEERNRPVMMNDVIQNIGETIGKSAIQSSVNELIKQNKVFEKTYGKQKVYCIVQDRNQTSEEITENLLATERKITKISQDINEIKTKIQNGNAELKNYQITKTYAEVLEEKNQFEEKLKTLEEELDKYQSTNTKTYTEAEKTKIMNDYKSIVKEYRKRKRICNDILDAILENYPKTKNKLFEEIGIETDEDVNFKLTLEL